MADSLTLASHLRWRLWLLRFRFKKGNQHALSLFPVGFRRRRSTLVVLNLFEPRAEHRTRFAVACAPSQCIFRHSRRNLRTIATSALDTLRWPKTVFLRDCCLWNVNDAMGGVLNRLRALFFTKKLEVVLVGLENRCDCR